MHTAQLLFSYCLALIAFILSGVGISRQLHSDPAVCKVGVRRWAVPYVDTLSSLFVLTCDLLHRISAHGFRFDHCMAFCICGANVLGSIGRYAAKGWNTLNMTQCSEDCLFVNVYVPKDATPTAALPVMVPRAHS